MIFKLKRKTYSASKLFSGKLKDMTTKQVNKGIKTVDDNVNYALDELKIIKDKDIIKYLSKRENVLDELDKFGELKKDSPIYQTRVVAKSLKRWSKLYRDQLNEKKKRLANESNTGISL